MRFKFWIAKDHTSFLRQVQTVTRAIRYSNYVKDPIQTVIISPIPRAYMRRHRVVNMNTNCTAVGNSPYCGRGGASAAPIHEVHQNVHSVKPFPYVRSTPSRLSAWASSLMDISCKVG